MLPISRRTGSTSALRLADLASIVSARAGLIALASTASIALASNRFGGNQLLVGGGWGWDGWGGVAASTGASEPMLVGDGAPVIINIGVDPGPGDAGGGLSGGCVIHKLNYDNTGKYVGERQIPQC